MVVTLRSTLPNYGEDVLLHFQILRSEELLFDVELITMDGKRLPCHRMLLASQSSYFKAMFTNDMLESRSKEITLRGVMYEQLLLLVDFCYTGKMELPKPDGEAVYALMSAATFFQLDAAVDACAQYFKERLVPANCLGTLHVANEIYHIDLRDATLKYFDEHFIEILDQEEFFELSAEQLSDLLGRDRLRVQSEKAIFESIMSWVEHDKENAREKHIPKLLKRVRVPFLSPSYVAKRLKPICAANDCLHLLNDEQLNIKQRMWESEELVAIFKTNDIISFEKYCPFSQRWLIYRQYTDFKTFGALIFNKRLIIIGGCYYRKVFDRVDSFDWVTNTTRRLASLQTPRQRHCVALLNGLVYAVGGQGLNSVERYDPVADAWSYVASLNEERSNFGLVVYEGRLHAYGGSSATCVAKSSHECYEPTTNEWTPRAEMLEPRYHFGFGACGGFIYAVGGDNGQSYTNAVQRYDPRLDTWTHVMSLNSPGPRLRVVCHTYGGRLHVVRRNATRRGDKWSTSVDQYDPNRNLWVNVHPLRTAEFSFRVFSVMNSIAPTKATSQSAADTDE